MSHVQIRCPKCGMVTTLPRDVHRDACVCHACGQRLPQVQLTTPHGRLKLRDAAGAQPDPKMPPGDQPGFSQSDVIRASREMVRERPRGDHLRWGGPLVAWILFVFIGGAAAFLRYGGVTPQAYLEYIPKVGPIVLIAMHIVVLLKAFSDSIFQGILCLLVPMYSLYYLFGVSDDFALRAVVAGLLVGIGQDSALVFQKYGTVLIEAVNAWIASGG